jgi:hypothetical protein
MPPGLPGDTGRDSRGRPRLVRLFCQLAVCQGERLISCNRMLPMRVILFCIPVVLMMCAQSGAAEVWLAGIDPIARQAMNPNIGADFMSMFHPGAPWAHAAKQVQVFEVSTQFLLRAPDDSLSIMFADLKRRNIALAVSALMLPGQGQGEVHCGMGVEGYSAPKGMVTLAARVQRLGGKLAYAAMDEPLLYGHVYSGPNACRSSLPELAREVAAQVATIRRIFPDAKIGEDEPVGGKDPADWMDEITQWLRAYHDAVGEPLGFLHADIQWNGPWQQQLAALRNRIRPMGVRLGIIYNGDPSDQSGVVWVRHAEARFMAIEADPAMIPDDAVLQSWHEHPMHNLPESDPGTMTYLVDRYAMRHRGP